MSTVPGHAIHTDQGEAHAFAVGALKRANERLADSRGVGDAADFLARELDQAYMERLAAAGNEGGGDG